MGHDQKEKKNPPQKCCFLKLGGYVAQRKNAKKKRGGVGRRLACVRRTAKWWECGSDAVEFPELFPDWRKVVDWSMRRENRTWLLGRASICVMRVYVQMALTIPPQSLPNPSCPIATQRQRRNFYDPSIRLTSTNSNCNRKKEAKRKKKTYIPTYTERDQTKKEKEKEANEQKEKKKSLGLRFAFFFFVRSVGRDEKREFYVNFGTCTCNCKTNLSQFRYSYRTDSHRTTKAFPFLFYSKR